MYCTLYEHDNYRNIQKNKKYRKNGFHVEFFLYQLFTIKQNFFITTWHKCFDADMIDENRFLYNASVEFKESL